MQYLGYKFFLNFFYDTKVAGVLKQKIKEDYNTHKKKFI